MAPLSFCALPDVLHVGSKLIKKVVDDVSGEDLDSHLVRQFLSLPLHLDVKCQQQSVLRGPFQNGTCTDNVFLVDWADVDARDGILLSERNCSNASREPSVDAWTKTPASLLLTVELSIEWRSAITSLQRASSSSAVAVGGTSRILLPATAFSRSVADSFTPRAALTILWWTNCPLMRISFMGWGVRMARIVVRMGPLRPQTAIRSPSRNTPFERMQSIVVPRPSITFTSRTVHSKFSDW